MRHEKIIGMALVGLTLAGRMPAAADEDLTLQALPISAGAVELRWNQAVDSIIARQAKGGAFEPIRRSSGIRFRAYFDSGLSPDTEYTYRFGVPNGWWYDFGPPGTPCEIDFQRVSQEDVYSSEKGFGFAEAGGGADKRGRGNPVMQSQVTKPSAFIRDVPNGRYLVSVGGTSPFGFLEYQVTINGVEALPRTKAEARGRPVELIDFPVDVTDGKIKVELGAHRAWNYLKIVPDGQPVKALASATVRTHSIPHVVGVMRDARKPLADRLAAVYSLGDMEAAAAPAAPAIAEILLATEKKKGAMHWVALWSLWKIGPQHVSDRGQRAAAEKILNEFTAAGHDMGVLPAPARALIQGANADYPLFGQYQRLPAWISPGERMPPKVSDEEFFGKWDAAAGKWAVTPLVQYAFSANLAATQEAARRGDYDAAKVALLAYYRNRSDEEVRLPEVEQREPTMQEECYMRGVFWAGNNPIASFTVGAGWQWREADLGTSLASAFSLVEWDRVGRVAIRSRESEGHAPRLEIVTDKNTYRIEASGDTYIRGGEMNPETKQWTGEYVGQNYGTNDTLYVQEAARGAQPGNPVSEDTMRAYFYFDLPESLTSQPPQEEVKSVKLHVYATTEGDPKDVELLVLSERDSTFKGQENRLTWAGHTVATLIYKDHDMEYFHWGHGPGVESQWGQAWSRAPFGSSYPQTRDERLAYSSIFRTLDYYGKGRVDFPVVLGTGIRTGGSKGFPYMVHSEFMTPDLATSMLKAYYEHGRRCNGEPGAAGNHARSIHASWTEYNTYLPEISQPGWFEASTARLADNIGHSLFPDGSYKDSSVGYIMGTLRWVNSVIKMVEDMRGIQPSARLTGNLRGLSRYYMSLTNPAGVLYHWGNGGRAYIRDLVLEVGRTVNDPHMIYFGSKGEEGEPIPYLSTFYPAAGGIFTMRTSWTDEDGLGAFINARVGGGHSHPDALGLDIYAYGRPLIVDPGTGSYSQTDPAAAWMAGSTIAHNTIEINGKNQSRGGKSEMQAVTNPVFDYASCWHEAYANFRHYRRVLFVRPSFWIVSDYVRASSGRHTYRQAWHPELNNNLTMDEASLRTRTHFTDGPNVQIVPADPKEIRGDIHNGWVEAVPEKYIAYRKEGVEGDVTYDTVLFPTREGDNTVVSVERLAVKGENGELARTQATALKITIGKDRTGYYFQSYLEKPAAVEFGGIAFDGETAYVELDGKGSVTYAALRNGASLKRSGQPLVEVAKPVETLGVRVEGDTLRIESAAGAVDVTVACPADVKKVLLNGENTPFTRKDGVLRILTSGGIADFTLEGVETMGKVMDGARPAQFMLKAGAVEEPLVRTVAVRLTNRSACQKARIRLIRKDDVYETAKKYGVYG